MFIDVAQLKALSRCGVIDGIKVKAEIIDRKQMWKLLIHFKDKEVEAVLISQKKKIRYWIQLNTIVTFIEELCPSVSQLTVII